ncbi:hypothetical protein UFOVP588_23 [uncultured Caudovirales phage]|uniref:Uncharacterized protein n=1 Tax=uncultured Caudovirales phage TaxID=2100421 RepID=A0A6J5MXG6_9CAUD|nr:hypothetical protein UFOVP588_23 [uncultured Caudovirales phage]
MTQDEIIEMAREAGLAYNHDDYPDIWDTFMNVGREEIVAFANLVAAKEREACAKLVDYWESREGEHADAIRARGKQALAQPEQDGDCKKCKDGCPACDARKLQKEVHDLL